MADGSVGDKKSRWTSQISENLSRGDFTSAKDLAQQALAEFPDDPDLLSLEEKAIQGRELRVQAFQFMEEGKQLCAEENFEEAVQVLRSGLALDERNPTLRAALVDALLCQAQAVLEENVPLAEKLVGEALVLDPDNLVALSVARSIVEHKHTLAAMKAAPPNSNTPPGRPQSAPASISEGAKKISFQGAQPATIAQSGGNVAS